MGQWAGSERQSDGSITMPYFDYSAEALDLISALPVIAGFAWPNWLQTPEAQAFLTDHGNVARATPRELAQLTTAIVRSDRFTEGSIAGAFESGLLGAIVRRAARLVSSEPSGL